MRVRPAGEEAPAKVRRGPPIDDEGDLDLPVWAGVLPLRLVAGEPRPNRPADGPLPPLAAGRQEV